VEVTAFAGTIDSRMYRRGDRGIGLRGLVLDEGMLNLA
jgi:hypothetical protein